MTAEKKALLAIHRMFLKGEPSPLQDRLYEAFPTFRGFSSQERDRGHLEAVAVLGIFQTWKKPGDEDLHQVFFLVPSATEMVWSLAILKEMARDVLTTIKEKPTDRDAKMQGAKMIGELFNHLHIGILSDYSSPPERWIAFGYRHTDALVPEWLRKGLMTL